MNKKFGGNIPVLNVKGKSLAETWEKAILCLYKNGCEIETEYDKAGDSLSKDASMVITVEDPSSEPRIHKSFPGGLEDLQEYVMEVIEGIKDAYIRNPLDIEDTKWEYTYHKRIFEREMPITAIMQYLNLLSEEKKKELEKRGIRILLDMPWAKLKTKKIGNKLEEVVVINQMEACVDLLSKVPYTRRAQIITWQPEEDLVSYDPPCLQSLWFRISKGEDNINRLNMNIRMRSNDAYGANFMNMFAFISVQEYVANGVSKRREEKVKLGRYMHVTDSFHIYGKDLNDFKKRFLTQIKERTFEERTYRSNDKLTQEIMQEAKPKILEKVAKQAAKYKSTN